MNDIRARFEEICPVPKRIYWSESRGEYMPQDDELEYLVNTAIEWDARLDTFTRCQETTDVYVSLVEEMVASLSEKTDTRASLNEWLYRAKQIMEQKK